MCIHFNVLVWLRVRVGQGGHGQPSCVWVCICICEKETSNGFYSQIFHWVAEPEHCQGSQPVHPWYVDSVALIHKSKGDRRRTCVCVRKRDRESFREFTVQFAGDTASCTSNKALTFITNQQNKAS